MIGIENLGENLKSINQEMDSWRNPEVQEVEREYAEVERQLLAEVPPPNPVSARPSGANTPPENQHSYPAQRSNLFPVAGLANIPISTEWTEDVEVTALKKPYPRAPTPVNLDVTVCKGFNAGKDGQSKIPQFFAQGSDAVNKPPVNVAAMSSMKSKLAPSTTPEIQCEKGWYISPFDGKKKMTNDNPALVEQEKAELERITEKVSSFISSEDEARIRAEVRDIMQKKFAAGHAKLESNPVRQKEAFVNQAQQLLMLM